MNFRPELAGKVLTGQKTVTRRPVSDNPRSPWSLERAPALVGRDVAVCPGRGKPAIARVLVVAVELEPEFDPCGLSARELALEGFDSSSAFMGAWADLHRSLERVDVWRVAFAFSSTVHRLGR